MTVRVARTASPGTAPVSAPPPTAGRPRRSGSSEHRPGPGASSATSSGSPGRPPMPSTPSTTRSAPGQVIARTEVGTRSSSAMSISRPPAARSAASPRSCGVPRQRTAVTAQPRAGQPGAGEQRVAAVVARTDQDHHPGAVDPAAECGRQVAGPRPRRARRRRAASSCRRRPPSMAAASSGADRSRPCTRIARTQASQITTAEAMPASWDRLTWIVPTPSSAGPVGDRPGDHEAGRPPVVGQHLRVLPGQSRRARRAPWPAPPWPRTGPPATPPAARPPAG